MRVELGCTLQVHVCWMNECILWFPSNCLLFSGSVHPNDSSGLRWHWTWKLGLFWPFSPSYPGRWLFTILSTVLPFTTCIHTLDKKGILPFLLFPLNQANCCFWNKPQYKQTLFYCILLYCTLQMLSFLQIEGLWQPCIEQVYWLHLPNNTCSLRVFVSCFGNSHNISDFFIIVIFVLVICHQWSLTLLLWLTEGSDDSIFSNEVFFN